MNRTIAVGLGVAAGAALLEVALVPAVVLGGATAVLAPGLLRRARRAVRSLPRGVPKNLRVQQSAVKTVTFRVTATAVDYTANFVVLGDPTIAAGLTGIGLVAGPFFYFVHETAWNYYHGPSRMTVDVAPTTGGFQVSRAVAKTITFRSIATVMDFSTNLLVLGDLATAAGLSAVAFVLGPIVYLGHEKVWERFGSGLANSMTVQRLPALTGP